MDGVTLLFLVSNDCFLSSDSFPNRSIFLLRLSDDYGDGNVLSVVCYLVYPTSFQRPVPPDGFWGNFIKLVYHGSYRGLNCAPSLHCSSCFLVICVSFTCAGMSLWVRVFTVSIAIMIVLSTLTTKQHTLIDVLTAVPLFLISRILGILLTIRYFTPILTFVGK